MPNSNSLEGIMCPNCKQTHRFEIEVTAYASVTDQGVEDVTSGENEWFNHTSIRCPACHTQGEVGGFTYPRGYPLKSLRLEIDHDEHHWRRETPPGSLFVVDQAVSLTRRVVGCPATGATLIFEIDAIADSFEDMTDE